MTETKAQTVRGAVEKREAPKSIEVVQRWQDRFAEVLPQHVESKAFVGAAVAALRRDPKLLEAAENSPAALVNALVQCAALGHQPGSKEFYLTVRRNKDNRNLPEIVGLEGYRGVVERMYRSGAVASVIVREVCEGDHFEFVEGVHERPVHKFDPFGDVDRSDPSKIIGVYAYAILANGATSRVVLLSRHDIEATRQRSDAGRAGKGPWTTDYRAMVWKTAAHRLEPWVPTSAEYRREQMRAEAAADNLRHQHDLPTSDRLDFETGEILDAEVVEP